MTTRTTIAGTLATLVLVATTACATASPQPAAPTTSTPAATPSQPTAQRRWLVTGTGHAGPKIGSPGPEQTKYIVYCIPADNYDPKAVTEDPNAPIRELEVEPSVADTVVAGDPCPPGQES
jgi:hypothetical protein